MLRHTMTKEDLPLFVPPPERTRCNWITGYVIVQCILVYIGALSVHCCAWSPRHSTRDWDKLARVMYLYDPAACGYRLRASPAILNVHLSNDTRGFSVLPIHWAPAVVAVSTRLSTTTRRYMYTSMVYHGLWFLSAVALTVLKTIHNSRVLKIVFTTFFVMTFCILLFDITMALLNITHIQKSLNKAMILRYSGWSVEMKLNGYGDFGGWLPLAATFCWLRGIVFFCLNVYCFTVIRRIRIQMEKTEVRQRSESMENAPIPDANLRHSMEDNVLYYRQGEDKPVVAKSIFYG